MTDRLGRRRVLTWSILVYALSAFLAGFSTSFGMLLALRCTTFIGVCVEFVAAAAWMPGGTPAAKMAFTAALLGTLVYAGGFVASFWLPEPAARDLAE